MPAFRANAANRIRRRASLAPSAALAPIGEYARTIHSGAPRIQLAVFGAIIQFASIAEVSVTGTTDLVVIVQVLGHPVLHSNLDRSIDLPVALVQKLSVLTVGKHFLVQIFRRHAIVQGAIVFRFRAGRRSRYAARGTCRNSRRTTCTIGRFLSFFARLSFGIIGGFLYLRRFLRAA